VRATPEELLELVSRSPAAVAFFKFNPKTRRIRSARFFWNV
jgi:hypothetical protein